MHRFKQTRDCRNGREGSVSIYFNFKKTLRYLQKAFRKWLSHFTVLNLSNLVSGRGISHYIRLLVYSNQLPLLKKGCTTQDWSRVLLYKNLYLLALGLAWKPIYFSSPIHAFPMAFSVHSLEMIPPHNFETRLVLVQSAHFIMEYFSSQETHRSLTQNVQYLTVETLLNYACFTYSPNAV